MHALAPKAKSVSSHVVFVRFMSVVLTAEHVWTVHTGVLDQVLVVKHLGPALAVYPVLHENPHSPPPTDTGASSHAVAVMLVLAIAVAQCRTTLPKKSVDLLKSLTWS